MIFLTDSEKKVVLFLTSSLILGSALLFLRDAGAGAKPAIICAPASPPGGPASMSVTKERRVDINSADEFALCGLSGIGPGLARRIIDYRESRGRFAIVEDLKNVKGIGERKFQRIKDLIVAK